MQTRQDAIAGFEDTLARSELFKLLLICWMDRIGAMRCMFCTFTIILNDDNWHSITHSMFVSEKTSRAISFIDPSHWHVTIIQIAWCFELYGTCLRLCEQEWRCHALTALRAITFRVSLQVCAAISLHWRTCNNHFRLQTLLNCMFNNRELNRNISHFTRGANTDFQLAFESRAMDNVNFFIY